MAAGDKYWKVLLKHHHIERSGDTPPRVGDSIALPPTYPGGVPLLAMIAEILPSDELGSAGTIVVELFKR